MDELAHNIEKLTWLLQSDFTRHNLVEAIESLTFEIKRYNDAVQQSK